MRVTIVAAALLATSVVDAATPIDGWYSGLFGGYTYVPSNINTARYGAIFSGSGYKPGYDAGGSLGFKSNPLRYEGELTYLNVSLKKFKRNGIPQTGIAGSNNAFLAMANVYYDFPGLLPPIQPYLGFGIGYGWLQAKLNSTGPVALVHYKGTNTEFTYQATAGLTYNFSENYALTIGYRYISTVNANQFGSIFQANLASLGAIYRFDETRYK